MARKKGIPIVEVARQLAPRIDGRVKDLQQAVQQQQKRDIKKSMKTHRA